MQPAVPALRQRPGDQHRPGHARQLRQGPHAGHRRGRARRWPPPRRSASSPGSTLWYDLEGFDADEGPLPRVRAGVPQRLDPRAPRAALRLGRLLQRRLGHLDARRGARQRPRRLYHLPDQIWIARWDGEANTSTSYIRNDGWRPGGRMKQYLGGHNETWGGVTINIDRNFLDLGTPAAPRRRRHCGGVARRPRRLPARHDAASRPARWSRRCSACSPSRRRTPARLNGRFDADDARRRPGLADGPWPPGRARRSEPAQLDVAARDRTAAGAEVRLDRAGRARTCSAP